MVKKGRVPLRLDIIGLNPTRFQNCLKNSQALVESRTKGSVSAPPVQIDSLDQLYEKIASIASDFQKAYGRAVQIRVFERSSNRFLEKILGSGSARGRPPEFFVNGVKIYSGVPNSFSELDEAIERAFGKA